MALNGDNSSESSGFGLAIEGEVHSVALPSWMRPAFAVPLVTFGAGSNTVYIQTVDVQDRIVGVSPFDPEGDALVHLDESVAGVRISAPSLHAVVAPDGAVVAGTREALAPVVSTWIPKITWPLTRLTFADFVGDEREIMTAADAALKQKAERYGRREASVWFANAVVFPRIQRTALQISSTAETHAQLDAALDEMTLEVSEGDIVAWVSAPLAELLEGTDGQIRSSLAMASKLAMLVSPRGLSLRKAEGTERRSVRPAPAKPNPGGMAEDGGAVSPINPRHGVETNSGPNAVSALRRIALDKVSTALGVRLKRRRGAFYETEDGETRAVISISRRYHRSSQSYWYGFYASQQSYLGAAPSNYLILGAADTSRFWAIPAPEIDRVISGMHITKRPNGQTYRHIVSRLLDERCVIMAGGREFDISPYEI